MKSSVARQEKTGSFPVRGEVEAMKKKGDDLVLPIKEGKGVKADAKKVKITLVASLNQQKRINWATPRSIGVKKLFGR